MPRSAAATEPQARADHQRERILRMTIPLVAKRGVDNLRLRDVAEASGVSIGTLQHYFTTRDALVLDAFAYHSRAIVADLAATAASLAEDPSGWIDALFRKLVEDRRFRQRAIVWLEFASASTRSREFRALICMVYDQWREPLQRAITEGVARGVFRPIMATDELVDTVLALIDGFELAHGIAIQSATPEAIYRRLVATTQALLGVSPSASGDRNLAYGS